MREVISEKTMVANILNYFKKLGIRAKTDVRTTYGYIDIFLPDLETIIEVKKDGEDLHTALGQLLTYQHGLFLNRPKLALVYDGDCTTALPSIFHTYHVEVLRYSMLLENCFEFSDSDIKFKESLLE